jgi:sugar phosphate isomerase/epimerase
LAKELKVNTVTCHPLPQFSLEDAGMQKYAQTLSAIQKDTGITILLENMSAKYGIKFIDAFFPLHQDMTDVTKIAAFTKAYGLQMTLDIDHLHKPQPEKEPWFEKSFPQIANIHLSSFTNTSEHLPLYLGDFKSHQFLKYLKTHNYTGGLTFEIYYPRFFDFFGYDFSAIKQSMEFIQEYL